MTNLQVPQSPGLVNTKIIMTICMVCRPVTLTWIFIASPVVTVILIHHHMILNKKVSASVAVPAMLCLLWVVSVKAFNVR